MPAFRGSSVSWSDPLPSGALTLGDTAARASSHATFIIPQCDELLGRVHLKTVECCDLQKRLQDAEVGLGRPAGMALHTAVSATLLHASDPYVPRQQTRTHTGPQAPYAHEVVRYTSWTRVACSSCRGRVLAGRQGAAARPQQPHP